MLKILSVFILVRISPLFSSRIGHFAANTELYLCERKFKINVPKSRFIDVFFLENNISNYQLYQMWNRKLILLPRWPLYYIHKLNRRSANWKKFEALTNSDRDYHNLLDKCSPQLEFTTEEDLFGRKYLEKMGIGENNSYVCLNVRDSAYLEKIGGSDFSYHDYRDSQIQNYLLAAEYLTTLGFYVIRMGARVKEKLNSSNPKIIDYATNGMRTDFMDIYLGANCSFCISTSTGWDCIPYIFRRPIVYVNVAVIGGVYTFRKTDITIFKHFWSEKDNKILSIKEIIDSKLDYLLMSDQYKNKGIRLIENTPEEIKEATEEMVELLSGKWKPSTEDTLNQKKFWDIFPLAYKDKAGRPLHGKIQGRIASKYLKRIKIL